jgi:endogenous inhibitor of DNA gyrase (YacG/DUF329 family)
MRKGVCPLCKKEWESDENKDYPFCCSVHKMADLYGWLNEEYFTSEPLSHSTDDEEAIEE